MVHGTPGGVSATILSTTCESHTTRSGGRLSRESRAAYSRSLTTIAAASLSSASRIICTWGRISRPFGAWRSMGTISTASPPGGSRSPASEGARRYSSGQVRSSRSLNACTYRSRPAASRQEHSMVSVACARRRSRTASQGAARSVLFTTTMAGSFRRPASSSTRSSNAVQRSGSAISTTTSARSNTAAVRCSRFSESSDTSSTPAVSRKTTGPIGSSSIGFSTTSVVVPGTGEVMATSCPATRLRKLDFPTFVRPKRPICNRRDLGVVFIPRSGARGPSARPERARDRPPPGRDVRQGMPGSRARRPPRTPSPSPRRARIRSLAGTR